MRSSRSGIPTLFAALAAVLGCQGDRVLRPEDQLTNHSALVGIAVRLQVDVEHGTVQVLPATAAAGARDGGSGPPLSFAILGTNEVAVTASNLVRSAPVNNKVTVTFDAAITNRLTSASLVPSSFPSTTGAAGLILFPFQVTQAVGGNASQVIASADWNGDGSAGSGAPRNFFNDFGCAASSAASDCFRWEQYPAPLGPGETTAPQRVGFTLPSAISSFTVLVVLAADISNDLPAVARIEVTPPSSVMNDGFPAYFSAVAYDALNHPLTWATLKWTSADITALSFQYGGALVGVIAGPSQIVHGRTVGQTSFTVSSGGISVVVPVDIQVNTVALVQLYTPDSSITVGDQIQGDARVKDHSGLIIPGLSPTWSTTDPNVITVDQNGLITAVGTGTADVVATAGLHSASVTITVDRRLTGSVAGTMRDLDGQPVKGANVRARGLVEVNTTTADDGSYSFTDLPIAGTPAGLYILDWSPSGCVPGDDRIVLQVGGVVPLDITVNCPPTVSGVLTSVQGTLPAGLTVELTPDAGGNNRVGAVQADGSYLISGFPAGGYFIFVNGLPPGCTAFGAQSISLTQQAHYVKNWSVDCPPLGGLTGRVSDIDGQDVAGATLDTQSQTDGKIYSTITDAFGAYLLYLPPDRYSVTLQKAGACTPRTNTYTVPQGSPIPGPQTLDCPWHIRGKVVAVGASPAGVIVYVSSPTLPREHATVLSDGTYEIVEYAYPEGSSGALSLSLSGVPSICRVTGGPFSVSVTQQMQLQVPDFTLDCRPPVVLVVVNDGASNPNGQPLIGMDVRLSGKTQLQGGKTDQNGEVLFPNAELGYSTVFVNSTISGCKGGTSSVITEPGLQYRVVVPVSCSTLGALEGTITTALGNPLVNVRVAVGPYTLTTDARGHWGVAGLPPGPLQVQRLDAPAGCPAGTPIAAAVIPKLTLQVNETVNCNGF